MNTVIGDKLQEALQAKKNDINSYIWKMARKEVAGQKIQQEIKLMDATPEQLKTFMNHCNAMLYNSGDKNNPGRYVLQKIIKDQTTRCNAQLFMYYVKSKTGLDEQTYRTALLDFLNNNDIKTKDYKSIPISETTDGIEPIFNNLTVDIVIDATLDKLGLFNKKHITLTFLTKLGVWFTNDERRELDERAKRNATDRLNLIKEELGLKPNVSIRTNPKGLCYKDFRAMIHLRNQKYSDLTIDQLTTLRDRVLFELNLQVEHHIHQWEERKSQILEVAKAREISIE